MNKVFVLMLALMVPFTATAAAGRTLELKVDGLVCAFCAQGIEKKLRRLDATDDVFVSLENKLVAVSLKPGRDIADQALDTLLKEAGYTLVGVQRSDTTLDALRQRVKQP